MCWATLASGRRRGNRSGGKARPESTGARCPGSPQWVKAGRGGASTHTGRGPRDGLRIPWPLGRRRTAFCVYTAGPVRPAPLPLPLLDHPALRHLAPPCWVEELGTPLGDPEVGASPTSFSHLSPKRLDPLLSPPPRLPSRFHYVQAGHRRSQVRPTCPHSRRGTRPGSALASRSDRRPRLSARMRRSRRSRRPRRVIWGSGCLAGPAIGPAAWRHRPAPPWFPPLQRIPPQPWGFPTRGCGSYHQGPRSHHQN